jgi:hypothetical protein
MGTLIFAKFLYYILLTFMFLVLHPCHKLKYFKTVSWEDGWVDAAEQIVRDEFEHKYTNGSHDDDNHTTMLLPKKNQGCVRQYILLILY